MRRLILLGVLCLVGCGADQTVHVGGPGQAGVIKRDIDKAQNVAATSSNAMPDGESIAYDDRK